MASNTKPDSANSARKRAMLEALERNLGLVSHSAKAAGIDRQTHYNWLAEDPAYKAAVDAIKESVLDFAESHLYRLIKDGNPQATIFLLKTKGKNRGYVERTEVVTAEKVNAPSWFE